MVQFSNGCVMAGVALQQHLCIPWNLATCSWIGSLALYQTVDDGNEVTVA